MKKTTTILAAVGGVTFVAVAAAGYFAWSAQAAKTAALEGDDEGAIGLEESREKADRLSRKPIYPGAESIKALTEARESLVAWKDEAFAFASRGDRKIQPTTDAAFKEFIVGDARRLLTLPAGEEQKTLDATFDFGPFKPYIFEGKMPEQATLPELQRKWDDVVTIIETLSASGIEKITAVSVKAAAQPQVEEPSPKRGKRPQKKSARLSDSSTSQPVSYTYVVACKTRPTAFVKALNALATDERFMAVEDISLRREKDALAEGLGAEKKDEAAASTSGRRRRRSSFEQEAKVEEKKADEALYTIITDPATDLPLDVQLTVTVYDFRSLEENKEGEVEK